MLCYFIFTRRQLSRNLDSNERISGAGPYMIVPTESNIFLVRTGSGFNRF